MADDPHTAYRRWLGELWDGRYEVAEELIAEDFTGHWPDREVTGRQALVDLIRETREMFTELTFKLDVGPIAEGDLVAGRWTGSGTTPEGATRFFGNDLLRLDGEGRFTEYWVASSAG